MSASRLYLAVVLLNIYVLGNCVTSVAQTTLVASNAEHQPGIELYRKADYEAAAGHFQALVKKNKTDELSWYYLGLSLEQQDKSKDAAKAFESALKLNPAFAQARADLSYVYLRRQKYSQALKEAERALSTAPNLAVAHYVAGIIRLRSDNPQQALDSANATIRSAPQLAAAHLLRSLAVLGVYGKKVFENHSPRKSSTTSQPSNTLEAGERRRQKRVEAASAFKDAAGSLETYLRLQPADSSTLTWREQLESLQVYAKQSHEEQEKLPISERLWFGDEVTTRARILEKPAPQYTDAARNAGVSGTVVMRAVLAADGTVRHLILLRDLPLGLTQAAVHAARRIKFEPAKINGTSVSMVVQLEYNFHLSH